MSNHEALREAAAAKDWPMVEIVRVDLAELLAAFDALRTSATVKRGTKEYPAEFSAAYDAMKESGARWREGSTPAAAFRQWQARIKAGADAEQILEGARRYGAYIKATAGEPKMAQTFFGPGEHYTPEWAIPRATVAPRPQRAQQQSLASEEAMRRLDGMPAFDPNVIDMEISHGR